MILAGVPLPRTHDLIHLGALVPAGWASRFAPTDLFDLGSWAVSARYPDAAGTNEARCVRTWWNREEAGRAG